MSKTEILAQAYAAMKAAEAAWVAVRTDEAQAPAARAAPRRRAEP